MKLLHAMKPGRVLVATGALLVTTLFSATVTAHEEAASPYTMAVIADDAYGIAVTRGNYDIAIRKITRNGRKSKVRFADQVNLCVAYAKTVELDKAGTACDKALEDVRKRRTSKVAGSAAYRNYHQDLAIALSNRGVVRAVGGEFDLAREDFVAAIELQGKLSRIARNHLDRLEQVQAL